MIILLIIFVLLNIIDVILTNKILDKGGIELNPVMKLSMKYFGDKWWIPKLFICLGCIVPLHFIDELYSIIGLSLMNCLYLYVVYNNTKVLREYK